MGEADDLALRKPQKYFVLYVALIRLASDGRTPGICGGIRQTPDTPASVVGKVG